MALKYISNTFKTALKNNTQDIRLYADFRNEKYTPATIENDTYNLAIKDRNRVGGMTLNVFEEFKNLISNFDMSNASWTLDATYQSSRVYGFDSMLRKKVTTWSKGTDNTTTIATIAISDFPALAAGDYSASSYVKCNVAVDASFGIGDAGGYDWSSSQAITADTWTLIKLSLNTAKTPTKMAYRMVGTFDSDTVFKAALPCTTETADVYPGIVAGSTGLNIKKYVMPMPDQFTARFYIEPWFQTASGTHTIAYWGQDSNNYLKIYYNNGVFVEWKQGGTARTLSTSTTLDKNPHIIDISMDLIPTEDNVYDGGTASNRPTDVLDGGSASNRPTDIVDGNWRAGVSTTNCALYVDRVLEDFTWSGVPDIKTKDIASLQLGSNNSLEFFNGEFIQITIFDTTSTQSDIDNDFKDILNERIVFDFNGNSWGQTRCKISSTNFKGYNFEAINKRENGSWGSNRISCTLHNINGEFTDNQVGTYNPSIGQYNGSASQLYLQRRSHIYIEQHNNNIWDYMFIGRIDNQLWKRRTVVNNVPSVTISCDDGVEAIAKRLNPKAQAYENVLMSDLMENLLDIAQDIEIKNYLSNANWISATPTNHWTVTNGTLTRVAGGLDGVYEGNLVSSGSCEIEQIIEFADSQSSDIQYIRVGETWLFSTWIKSTDSFSVDMVIKEKNEAGTTLKTTTETTSYNANGGWKIVSVTVKISTTTIQKLAVVIAITSSITCQLDGGMLTQSKSPLYSLGSTATGNTPVAAEDYGTINYNLLSSDIDEIDITHPYALISENESPWNRLKGLGVANLCSYIGMDYNNILKVHSDLAQYDQPDSLYTIDSVKGVSTSLIDGGYNTYRIKGSSILNFPYDVIVWKLSNSNAFDVDQTGYNDITIADGDFFPDVSTYGEFWIRYDELEIEENEFASVSLSGGTQKIIGIKNVRAQAWGTGGDLTQIILDSTLRKDSIRILYKNNTGANIGLREFVIYGQPIWEVRTDGYQNDNFVDIEDIRENGVNILTIDQKDIVTSEQNLKLSQYHFRNNIDKKHLYSLNISGILGFIEPGENYTLNITDGASETINTPVSIESVQIESRANSISRTSLLVKELRGNITYQSNVLNRYISRGSMHSSPFRFSEIVIAPSDYIGYANIYCDGTADEVQINDAITLLSEASGGGEIKLTRGTFNIADSIVLKSNIKIIGEGQETVIDKDGNFDLIIIDTQSNIVLEDFKLTRTDSNVGNIFIECDDSTDLFFNRLNLYQSKFYGFAMDGCDNINIQDCIIDGSGSTQILLFDTDNATVQNNIIKNGTSFGLSFRSSTSYVSKTATITTNSFFNNALGIGGAAGQIVVSDISNCNISGNIFYITSSTANGIFVRDSLNITIANNDFSSLGAVGITIDKVGTDCEYIDISNNIITGCTDAIYCEDMYLSTITSNRIFSNTAEGIQLQLNCDNNTITGNSVSANTGTGILIGTAGCNNNIVTGNRSTANTTANYTDNGTATTIAGNDFT